MADGVRAVLLRGGRGSTIPAGNADADPAARGDAVADRDADARMDAELYADIDAAFTRLLAYSVVNDPYPDAEAELDSVLVPDAGPFDALPRNLELRSAEPILHAAHVERPGSGRRDRHDWPVELSSYQTAPTLAPDEGNGDRQARTPRRGTFSRTRT